VHPAVGAGRIQRGQELQRGKKTRQEESQQGTKKRRVASPLSGGAAASVVGNGGSVRSEYNRKAAQAARPSKSRRIRGSGRIEEGLSFCGVCEGAELG
jgi:hypothetical protein